MINQSHTNLALMKTYDFFKKKLKIKSKGKNCTTVLSVEHKMENRILRLKNIRKTIKT